MAKEWNQICKDCGQPFGYSDISLQRDLKKGLSRPERCQKCRGTHSRAIQSIASSHFALKPRINQPSILGYEFLGQIDHEKRNVAEPAYVEPNMKGVDIGLNETNIQQVYDALKNNQVVVVMAPTGSGKSTYIPSKLLYPLPPKETDYFTKRGPIIITQPRIAATIQIPNSIGKKFGGCSVGAGFDIGYCYSGDKVNYDLKRNRMVFTTDGSLINWIADGMIGDFSMIVIDEAHERSYNIESIINMVYRELLKYPNLKMMIISATIDSDSFEKFFAKTTKVKVLNFEKSEKTFGYEALDKWGWDDLKKSDFDEKIFQDHKREGEKFLEKYKSNVAYRLAKKVIEIVNKNENGGILGFLDGKENINIAVNIIRDELGNRGNIKVLPFHGELTDQERDDVIQFDFKYRRILIATNSAETSLTLEDVVYVVDSGIIKEEQWNSSTCRKGLETKFHSKAGCKQRWGRAGRVQKGFVEKLYSKDEFIKYFPNYTIPAVQRSNTEPMVLSAIASGQSNIDSFEMLTRPDDKEWQRAVSVIRERGLVDNDGDFTADGLEIYELSKAVSYILGDSKSEYNSTERSLDVACLLILADKYACLIEAATVIAMMPHMGNSLYWEMDGLFKWNKNYNLISKDYQIRLYESLKAGCIDDLDLSCKLYSLFEGNLFHMELTPSYRNWFIKEYAINEKCFAGIVEIRNALVSRFSEGKKDKEFRKLHLNLLNRVRILTSLAWSNKIVSLKKVDEILFENLKDKSVGTISTNCAGDWANEKKAIVGIFDQNEVFATVEENKRLRVPVSNFMIKNLIPVPKNNTIDIINAFRTHSVEINSEKQYSNLNCDLRIPVNRKVKIDSLSKTKKVKSSFGIQQSNIHSENKQDLFVGVSFKEAETENTSEFAIEGGPLMKDYNDCLIQEWKNIKNNPVATLSIIPLTYSNQFDKLKVGDKIEATVLRSVLNIKGIGQKEIVGFIASIAGFHYSLPVENIFIDYEDELLEKLIGAKITLSKAGITPTTKLPLFSRTNQIEKEREDILKLTEVTGRIVKKSSQEISCQVQDSKLQFPHFIKISIGHLTDDKRFLQMDGEIRIKLLQKKQGEPIYIDCVNDSNFDLTDNERKDIRNLLYKITSDNAINSSFTDCGIEINRTRLSASKKLLFDQITILSFEYPLLSEAIKYLHEKSWEMQGEIQIIQKKVEREIQSKEAKIKIQNNLAKNRGQLLDAYNSFTKLTENGKKLEGMIATARTESHRQQVKTWLSENDAKIQSKIQWIEKVKSFIKEDEDKLKNWKD